MYDIIKTKRLWDSLSKIYASLEKQNVQEIIPIKYKLHSNQNVQEITPINLSKISFIQNPKSSKEI